MTEIIEYEVVRVWGAVEVRRYPQIVLATVHSSYDDMAFAILFKYISEHNEASGKLAMTAPVLSDDERLSFVLPSGIDIGSTPRPLDSRIEISAIPARFIATIRFGGKAYLRDVWEKEKELLMFLKEKAVGTKGRPFLMRYNSPFTPGFLRRNEVGVEIREEDVTTTVDE